VSAQKLPYRGRPEAATEMACQFLPEKSAGVWQSSRPILSGVLLQLTRGVSTLILGRTDNIMFCRIEINMVIAMRGVLSKMFGMTEQECVNEIRVGATQGRL
jgi:hypothetical protein